MLYFPMVTIPLALLYIFITGDWVWAGLYEWAALLGVGGLTYAAQYFLTKSYQLGEVSRVSILSYLGVLYALILGVLFFKEWFNLNSLVGMSMVMAGVLLNVYMRSRKKSLAKRNNRVEVGR
jgi:drug/metabolite transporter (DMT)-like permease